MSILPHRLRSLPFFRMLDDATIDAIVERGVWFSLAGGWELFAQGSISRALYIVISGRLVVVRRNAQGEHVVGYVRAGEPVGEMSLLSGEPHSASVFALRDTEIIALPRAEFERLSEQEADLSLALARAVLARARRTAESFRLSAPRVFAFVASSPSVDIDGRAREIARLARNYGLRAKAILESDGGAPMADFETIESAHDAIFLAVRMGENDLYRFALRHADRFFVFARRDARPARPFPLSPSDTSPARKFRLVDLVMIEEGAASSTIADWSDAVGANRVFHWRSAEDAHRLARVATGKSVGLVLSGGGARAYAHLGAIRALREAGVPIDVVGGASMGAIVGACFAMGWSDAEIEERIREGFVESNPLADFVLPVVALTKGRLVDERLAKNFGEALIEELKVPFFCVASDLVKGALEVRKSGSLREALRASASLPGILPPVARDGMLLVDGAVIDNFPTAAMTQFHRGLTIGIDVAERGSIDVADFNDPPGFFDWVRRHGVRSAPPIVTLLMRAATARHEAAAGAHPADLNIAPNIPGVELRDWRKFDQAADAGYFATRAAIEERLSDLQPIIDGARKP